MADVLAVPAREFGHPMGLAVLMEPHDGLQHIGRISYPARPSANRLHAVSTRRFGISTHLFHDERLTRDHLEAVARHGFDAVEVFATRSHFDYHDDAAVAELAGWLRDTRMTLHSVHAPIAEAMRQGQGVGPYSTAAADESRRKAAVAEIGAAITAASRLGAGHLVVHLGVPAAPAQGTVPGDNQPAAARRSVEEIVALAGPAGIRVALEVIPNALSTPDALVRSIDDLEDVDVGVCLDYGHAHLLGDVGEALETLSGHLSTTHLHDNTGRRDDHLVPFEGSIDWNAAIMGTQKIGYDDVLMFEAAGGNAPGEVLRRLAAARARLDALFLDF